MADARRVPADKITSNVDTVEQTKPADISKQGAKLPVTDEEEPTASITIDLANVPESLKQITVGDNVKEATITVTKKDGTTERRPFGDLDKQPIVVDELDEEDNIFGGITSLTITPKKPSKKTDKVYTITVKIHVCGE